MLGSGVICRRYRSYFSPLPPRWHESHLERPGPSLGPRVAPRLCRTSHILDLPCLVQDSLLPFPQRYPRLFLSATCAKMLLGDPGDATPNALSSDCAPRSSLLLSRVASKSIEESGQGWKEGVQCSAPSFANHALLPRRARAGLLLQTLVQQRDLGARP